MQAEAHRIEVERPGRWVGFRKGAGRDGADDAIYCGFALNDNNTPVPGLCISADDPNPRTLTAAVHQRRAEIWTARGVASPQMQTWLDDAHDDEVLKVLVWAKTARVDSEAVMAGRVRLEDVKAGQASRRQDVRALCAATRGCEAHEVGGPMLMIKAPAKSLRKMRHAPALAVMEPWPEEEMEGPHGAPHVDFEAMNFDLAQETPYGATGDGVTIAVFESGKPGSNSHQLFAGHWDPSDIYCPSTEAGGHGQTVMSIIGADHSLGIAAAPPKNLPAGAPWAGLRDIDGAAPGAQMLHASLAGDCNFEGAFCLPPWVNCGSASAGCNMKILRCMRNHCVDSSDCEGGDWCSGDQICRPSHLNAVADAAEWAASMGSTAAVYNYSWGPNMAADATIPCLSEPPVSYRANARYMDWLSLQFPWPVIVSTTGNLSFRRPVGNHHHNGIVVGASLSNATIPRGDDVMWDDADCRVEINGQYYENTQAAGSQARNPGDLELPHVVAAAESMALSDPGSGQWYARGPATSWAAPKVAGLAALLLDAENLGPHAGGIANYPEAVKAIIMATATTDVDGYVLDLFDDHDDRDGAGEINAVFAVDLVQNGELNSWDSPDGASGVNRGLIYANAFNADGEYPHFVETGPVPSDTIQVALAWDVSPGCHDTTCPNADAPTADLAFGLSVLKKYDSWFGPIWLPVASTSGPTPTHNHLVLRVTGAVGDEYQIRLTKTYELWSTSYAKYGLAWANFSGAL